jgi:hypothetical protein
MAITLSERLHSPGKEALPSVVCERYPQPAALSFLDTMNNSEYGTIKDNTRYELPVTARSFAEDSVLRLRTIDCLDFAGNPP